MSLGSYAVDITGDASDVERSITDGIGGSLKKVGGIAAGLFAGVQIGGFVKDAIGQASDLNESLNAVQVILGDAGKSFLKFGQTAGQNLGITQAELNSQIVPIAAGLTNAGLSGEKLADSLKTLSTRAADVGSVFNTDVDQVMGDFAAGLRGEGDSLEKYGVQLNAAAIDAKAMALGLVDAKGKVTDAGKTQGAYALILEQTSKAQGDFKNTSGGVANAGRIIGASFADIKAQFGATLLPAVQGGSALILKTMPLLRMAFTGIGSVITSATKAFSVFFGGLTGRSELGEFSGALGVINDLGFKLFMTYQTVMPKIRVFIAQLPAAFAAARTAVQPIVDQVIATVRALIPAVMGVVRAVAGALPGIFRLATAIGSVLAPVIGAIVLAVLKLVEVFGPPLLGAIGMVASALGALGGFLAEHKAILIAVAAVIGGVFVAQMVRAGVQAAITAAQTIAAWTAQGLAMARLYVQIVGAIAAQVAGYVRAGAAAVASVARQVAAWVLLGAQSLLQAARIAAAWLIAMGPIALVIAAVAGVVFLIIKYWDQIKAATIAVWNAIVGAVKAAWDWIKGAITWALAAIGTAIMTYLNAWKAVFVAVWGAIKAVTSAVWNGIKAVISAALSFVKTMVTTEINGVKTVITAVWNAIKAVTSAVWNGIKAILQGIWNGIKAAAEFVWSGVKFMIKKETDGIKAIIRVAVDTVKNIWAGIKAIYTKAKEIFEMVAGAVKDGVDRVIDFVTGIPGKILDVFKDAGSFLKDIGKKIIQGLIDGIGDMFGSVKDKLGDLTGKLTSWKGPPAKDKKLLHKTGRQIIDGFVQGLESRFPHVQTVLQTFTDSLPMKIGHGLDAVVKETERKLARLDMLLAKEGTGVAARLDKRTTELHDLRAAAKDYAASVRDAVTGTGALTSLDTRSTLSLQRSFDAVLARAQDFAATIRDLQKLKLDPALLKQLLAAGPEQGLAAAQAIAAGGKAGVREINGTQQKLLAVGKNLGKDLATQFYGHGIAVAQGLVDGLRSQRDAIQKEMQALGRAMVVAIRKELKIHSPSELLAEKVGVPSGQGVWEGFGRGLALTPSRARAISQQVTFGAGAVQVNGVADPLAARRGGYLAGEALAAVMSRQRAETAYALTGI